MVYPKKTDSTLSTAPSVRGSVGRRGWDKTAAPGPYYNMGPRPALLPNNFRAINALPKATK